MAQSETKQPNAKQPWRERWEFVAEMSAGGQGRTSTVKRISDGHIAVLKTLKRPKNDQARGRMAREVMSLRVLHQAGCKVPEVFDDNTNHF